MAIVKGPALSIDASGNLGAICYSKWRGRSVARSAWSGTVPCTPDQVVYQNHLGTLAQYWGGTLTEDEREAWRAFGREITVKGRLGDLHHPNGYNLFISRNMNRKRWGEAILNRPIDDQKKLIWWLWNMHYDLPGTRIRWMHWGVPSGEYPDLYEGWVAGPYNSPARRPIEPEFRYYKFVSPGVGLISKNQAADNKYYWMRMRLGDFAGIVSPFLYKQVQAA